MAQLRGIELRYVLAMYLLAQGHATITDLVDSLAVFARATEFRIHPRVLALRDEAASCRS
jgi:hypothetical protein